MSAAEVVSPATGEIFPFVETCVVGTFDITRCDETFLITENGKRFSVRENELFKVDAGIYFVRATSGLALLTQGPFTSDIRFPQARESFGQWIQDFLKQGFGLKGSNPRVVALAVARAFGFVLAVSAFAFLILPKAFSTSIAEAPTVEGFDKKIGFVFAALEKAVRAAPAEILQSEKVPAAETHKLRVVSRFRKMPKCSNVTETVDPDVLDFLSAKQRLAMRSGGECEVKK